MSAPSAEFSLTELAVLLGVPRHEIDYRVKRGRLAVFRPSGNPRGKRKVTLEAVRGVPARIPLQGMDVRRIRGLEGQPSLSPSSPTIPRNIDGTGPIGVLKPLRQRASASKDRLSPTWRYPSLLQVITATSASRGRFRTWLRRKERREEEDGRKMRPFSGPSKSNERPRRRMVSPRKALSRLARRAWRVARNVDAVALLRSQSSLVGVATWAIHNRPSPPRGSKSSTVCHRSDLANGHVASSSLLPSGTCDQQHRGSSARGRAAANS